MSAPPEAHGEYSRGIGAFQCRFVRRRTPISTPHSDGVESSGGARAALALAALIGAVLIVVSQFTALLGPQEQPVPRPAGA
jgi:hypothetical protein